MLFLCLNNVDDYFFCSPFRLFSIKTLRVLNLLSQPWVYLPGFSQAALLKIITPADCNQHSTKHQKGQRSSIVLIAKTMKAIKTCIVLSTINSLDILRLLDLNIVLWLCPQTVQI